MSDSCRVMSTIKIDDDGEHDKERTVGDANGVGADGASTRGGCADGADGRAQVGALVTLHYYCS